MNETPESKPGEGSPQPAPQTEPPLESTLAPALPAPVGVEHQLAEQAGLPGEGEINADLPPQRPHGRFPSPLWSLLPRLAVILALLLPLHDMVHVVMARMFYPLEHEWLEGEVANYSIRFSQHHSLAWLYPPFDRGDYCPHLYPPLYQIVVSLLFQVTGSSELGWGRLVSSLAFVALMAAVAAIVREGTRSRTAAVAGALLLPMFFKPVGYWYDLFRVDTLAYALSLWSCWFFVRRAGGAGALLMGSCLAAAAAFTKQTALLPPLVAGAVRLGIHVVEALQPLGPMGRRFFQRRPRLRLPVILGTLFAANAAYFLTREPLANMAFYLYKVPTSHFIYYAEIEKTAYQELWQYHTFLALLLPLAVWLAPFRRQWAGPWQAAGAVVVGLACSTATYLLLRSWEAALLPVAPNFSGMAPGLFSLPTFEFVVGRMPLLVKACIALTCGGLSIWGLRWLLFRTVERGAFWLGLLLLMAFVALTSWKKIGGYINNFMPLFVVEGVVFGFATHWLHDFARRRFPRVGPSLASALLLAVLGLTWFGTRYPALRHELASQLPGKDVLPQPPSNERAVQLYQKEVLARTPEERAGLPWWLTDGLRYDLPRVVDPRDKHEILPAVAWGRQIPAELNKEWIPRLMERLAGLAADGGVYLPHNNYLGFRTGSPIRASIDAIRDVTYMGKRTPENLLNRIRNKEFRHIVTILPLRGGWMTSEMAEAIESNYDYVGDLLSSVPWDAFRPVTGAPVKPSLLFRAKNAPGPEEESAAPPGGLRGRRRGTDEVAGPGGR